MRFINKNIKSIYVICVIILLLISYIKTFYAAPVHEGIIVAIPFTMLVIGALAGPAGSLILGTVGTLIVYLIF